MISKVKEKHPDWSEGWQLRGAVAAYNFGANNVQTKAGIDKGSAIILIFHISTSEAKNVQTKAGIDKGGASTCSPCDGNYSWDTMQRAKWLADN